MVTICPTITAEDPHIFREQIERVQPFAKRLHIDLMDGIFTPNKSIDLTQVWWPERMEIDIHLMFDRPESVISELLRLKPARVIVHSESRTDVSQFAKTLHEAKIACGLAVLPETPIETVASYLVDVQHLLIFSGNLGHQGGSQANLSLLQKIVSAKAINPSLEFAWDGGINDQNAKVLVDQGINVLDVGGFIQNAIDPQAAYKALTSAVN